ncbi:hypothetical protein DRQ50_02315 [bacterium]|nr:MAG: hypothetical protein DRQ50_02315 [bacterium]
MSDVIVASGTRCPLLGGRVLPVAILLVVWCTAGRADETNPTGEPPQDDPRAVFELLRGAWETEDPRGLADLVHDDGLRIHGTTTDARVAVYSPSQAFYYFKNLFQIHDTDAFIFRRMQQAEDTPRVHAMARWHRHRTGSTADDVVGLMIVLTRDGDGWALTEINIIR